ncbi:hypothetical protein VTN96DRAFT_7597 [Rasamsonia emersonii]
MRRSCWVYNGGVQISKEFRLCPRSRLQEIIRSAKEQHDIDFLVGTEIEFYIVDGDQSVQMVPNPSSAASLRNRFLPIVEEIVDCLINAGIAVHQFHSEGSPGLFEISLEPLPPVEAVDAVVYGQETIKTVCANHGLRGTMFPKPFEKLFTAGLHYHLSISRVDKQESFLAGLLGSWASLAAFCMPNYDSYTRVTRGQDVFWGYENRTAMIRKVSDGHWELRAPDGTSNPHLTLAAILAAGLKDVEEGKPLTVQDPKGYVFEPLTQEQRTELGITDAMPQSLEAALEALRADKTLPDALGAEIVEKYLKIKTMEEQAFREMTLQKRKSVSMNFF